MMADKGNRHAWRSLWAVFLFLLSTVWVLHLLKPLFDPDFYWHLKTGLWMWDNKILPAFDPFTIPPQPPDSPRTQFILTSYWLFQLILTVFYKMGGFSGIIIFRFILAALLIAIFYRFSVRKNFLVVLGAGIGITQILEQHFPERPQFISFICTALILTIIFTHLRERRSGILPLLIPLCLTMVCWANMHGGFILGQILLVGILLAEAVKFLHPKLSPLSGREYLNFAIAICAAILISIVNPNPLSSIEMMLTYSETTSYMYTSLLEYSTLYEHLKSVGGNEPVIAVITYISTFILVVSSRERTNITWMGLMILLGYMGLHQIRYYPLFLVCATLFAIQYFDTEDIGKISKLILGTLFITVVSFSLLRTPQNFNRVSKYGWVPASYFPVKVCDYINANGIDGNIYTLMNWGGYVIWRQAPQQKVFLDGRQLDPARFWEYLYGMNNWKMLFNKYNIKVVILPVFDASYNPNQLNKEMEMDPEWQLVCSANNGALFIRKNPAIRTGL